MRECIAHLALSSDRFLVFLAFVFFAGAFLVLFAAGGYARVDPSMVETSARMSAGRNWRRTSFVDPVPLAGVSSEGVLFFFRVEDRVGLGAAEAASSVRFLWERFMSMRTISEI